MENILSRLMKVEKDNAELHESNGKSEERIRDLEENKEKLEATIMDLTHQLDNTEVRLHTTMVAIGRNQPSDRLADDASPTVSTKGLMR